MPNWCSNKLIITGPDVPTLLNAIGQGDIPLLFQKIIPSPECLDMTAGGRLDLAIGAVARSDPDFFAQSIAKIIEILPNLPMLRMEIGFLITDFVDKEKEDALYARIDQALERGLSLSYFLDEVPEGQDYQFTIDNLVEMGKLILDNITKYGAPNWYMWRVQNWGTKWELDNTTRVALIEDHAAILLFDTAWSPPCPVIARLGEMYPDYKLKLSWHEGGNDFAGRLYIHGAKRDEHDYPGHSDRRERLDMNSLEIPKRMQWKIKGSPNDAPMELPQNIEDILSALENKSGAEGNEYQAD